MAQIIAFYPVDGSLERHTFDYCFGKNVDILTAITKEDDYHLYRLDKDDQRFGSIFEFIEDYNDEVLDGGWWAISLEMTEDEINEFFNSRYNEK